MKFAIQEDMLPGRSSAERFAAAKALGLEGVEVWGGSDLAGRVPDIALREYADEIGYIHLADSNRRLPGRGRTDFAAAASTLKALDYAGWATFACGEPGHNGHHAEQFARDLPASLAYLRQQGW